MSEKRETIWEEIDRPVGPQPIPTWCKGAQVDWHEGDSNPPTIMVKTVGEKWDDKVFRKEGKYFVAEHPDGRGELHAHDGAISIAEIQVFRSLDGALRQHRRCGPEWGGEPGFGFIQGGVRHGHEPGQFVKAPMRCTSQQDGYAGRHIWIMLDDGSPLILRGPWHLGAPAGYRSITTVDMDYARLRSIGGRRSPWWKNLGCFGLALREDVYIAVISRFLPHLPLARVSYSYGTTIEPFRPEWGEPKHFWMERQRAARAA